MARSFFTRPSSYVLLLTLFSLVYYLRTSKSPTPIRQLSSTLLPNALLPSQESVRSTKPRYMRWKPPPFQPLELEYQIDEAGNGIWFKRIVAVGDIHGDLPHLTRILRHMGLISLKNEWIGGRSILVQTGDIVDRGKDTIALYRFFDILRPQAERAGGAIINLLGNHELMNAMHDWRYVTPEDIASFGGERKRMEAMTSGFIGQTWRANYSITAKVPIWPKGLPVPKSLSIDWPEPQSGVPTSLVYFDDLPKPTSSGDPFEEAAISFVHGGIIPEYIDRLETPTPISKINQIGSSILYSLVNESISPVQLPRKSTEEQKLFWSELGPMWNRDYALVENEKEICRRAKLACEKMGVRRLVMGHTPDFDQVRSRCNGMILLIDTGISRAYGGSLSALEIMTTYTPQQPLSVPPAPKTGEPQLTLLDEPMRLTEPMNWLESEEVRAIYVGEERESELLDRRERMLYLPGE